MMWCSGGTAVQYLYHPDQPGQSGEDLGWDLGDSTRKFERGTWHRVETRIVMNEPGSQDGIVQSWLDGELVLDRRDIRFRDTNELAIDAFYFSTFFSGPGPQWAPPYDTYIDFDDFVISTRPITHQDFVPEARSGTKS